MRVHSKPTTNGLSQAINASRILAYGDPHGEWMPLLRACEKEAAAAVLIVGDCNLAYCMDDKASCTSKQYQMP